jgi:MscS family membrane protein
MMNMRLLLDIDWNFFDREFMGDKVSDYMWCAGIIVGTLLLKRPLANMLTRLSSGIAARFSYMKHKTKIRSMLFGPIERLLQVIMYYIAVHQLDNFLDHYSIRHFIGVKQKLDLKLGYMLDHVFLLLFIIFLTQVIARFFDFIYYLRMGKAQHEKNSSRMQLLPLIKEIAKLMLWTLSIFWILGSVFHVNIPALIAGLGIGGVAIALAGKETIENFFAAFTILSDKPFKAGDTIKLAEIEGVVERIGFRSTRLRSLDGSEYIIPNQNLVSQNLINLSARDNRLMKVGAHIKYGISHEALQLLITKIKEELLKTEPVKEPVDAVVESLDKETFQLVISYNLPHPLPSETKLADIKREINLKVFDIISANATLGTPVGTS